MEIYLLKSNGHYSRYKSKKVILVFVKEHNSTDMFESLKVLAGKICVGSSPILSNFPIHKYSVASQQKYRGYATRVRGEIITDSHSQNKVQGEPTASKVSYKYTYEIAKEGEVVISVSKISSKPISVCNLSTLLAAPNHNQIESSIVPANEQGEAKSLYPFLIEEIDKVLWIECPAGKGYKKFQSGLCTRLSTLAFHVVANQLGLNLESVTEPESGQSKSAPKGPRVVAKPNAGFLDPKTFIKHLIVRFVNEITSISQRSVDYTEGVKKNVFNKLTDYCGIDRFRLSLHMISFLTHIIDDIYKDYFTEAATNYGKAKKGRGNQDLISALNVAKFYLQKGREWADLDDEDMTEEFLTEILVTVRKQSTIDQSTSSRITTIFVNDFKKRDYPAKYFEKLVESYFTKDGDIKDLKEKDEAKMETEGMIEPKVEPKKKTKNLSIMQDVEVEAPERCVWNQLLWSPGIELQFYSQIHNTLLSSQQCVGYYDTQKNQLLKADAKKVNFATIIKVGPYFVTQRGYGQNSEVGIYDKDWQELCVKKGDVMEIAYIRKILLVDHKALRVYIIAASVNNMYLIVSNISISQHPKVDFTVDIMYQQPSNLGLAACVFQSMKRSGAILMTNDIPLIQITKTTKSGLTANQPFQKIFDVVDFEVPEKQDMLEGLRNIHSPCAGVSNDKYFMLAKSSRIKSKDSALTVYLFNIQCKSKPKRLDLNFGTYSYGSHIYCFSKKERLFAFTVHYSNYDYFLVTESKGNLLVLSSPPNQLKINNSIPARYSFAFNRSLHFDERKYLLNIVDLKSGQQDGKNEIRIFSFRFKIR